ncbi:MAG: Ada metal-binding domain-containing protein [Halobacteriota archaeon]
MTMKKQFLIILMVTIVLATVFIAGCTGDTTNTTSNSSATSTATTTPTLNPSPSPKATATPTATPTKTPIATPTPHVASCSFIGNSHTHVFHYAWCSDVSKIKPEHKVCFDTAQQALAAGYRPCQHCHPHD